MNGFTKKVMSGLMAVSSAIAPLGQAIGLRAIAVGSVATMAPMLAHAQKNHRLCGAVMEADKSHFAGVMIEVNKADIVTCGSIVSAATNTYGASTSFVGILNKIAKDWRSGFPSSDHLVARLSRCEDVTRWWFGSGAYGGDVCNSMQDYKLYRFFHYSNGSYSISK